MAIGYREDVYQTVENNALVESEAAHEWQKAYDALSEKDKTAWNILENSRALLAGEYEADDDEMRMAAVKLANAILPENFVTLENLNVFRGGSNKEDFASGEEALRFMVDYADGKEDGVSEEGKTYQSAFNEAKQKGGDTFDADAFDYEYAKQSGYTENEFDESMLKHLKGDAAFGEVYEVLENGSVAYKKPWKGGEIGRMEYNADMEPFKAQAQRADMVARFREHQDQQVPAINYWVAMAPYLSTGANEFVRRAAMSGTDKLVEHGGYEFTLDENAAYHLDPGGNYTAQAIKEHRATTLGGPNATVTAVMDAMRYITKTSGLQQTMTKDWSTSQLIDWLSAQPQEEIERVSQLTSLIRGKVTEGQWWEDAGEGALKMMSKIGTGVGDAMFRFNHASIRSERMKRFSALRNITLDVDGETRRQHLNSLALGRMAEDMRYEHYGWFKDSVLGAVEQLPIWGLLAATAPLGAVGAVGSTYVLGSMYLADSYDAMIERGVDHEVALVAASASAITQALVDHIEFGMLKSAVRSVAMADFMKSLTGNIVDGALKRTGGAITHALWRLADEQMRDTFAECVQEGLQKTVDEFAINAGRYFSGDQIDMSAAFVDSLKAGAKEAFDSFGTMLFSIGGAKAVGMGSASWNATKVRSQLITSINATRAIQGLETNGNKWGSAQISEARVAWMNQPNDKARIEVLKEMGLTQTTAEELHQQFRALDVIAERYQVDAATKLANLSVNASRAFTATPEGKATLKQVLSVIFDGENVDVTDTQWSDGDKVYQGIGIRIGDRIIPVAIDEGHQAGEDPINSPGRNVAASAYEALQQIGDPNAAMPFETFAEKWKDEAFREDLIKSGRIGEAGRFMPSGNISVAIQVQDANGNMRTEHVPAVGLILLNQNDASMFRASYKTVVHETLHAIARIVRDSDLLSEEERAELDEMLPESFREGKVADEQFDEEGVANRLERELGYLASKVEREAGIKTKHEGLRGWVERVRDMLGNVLLSSNGISLDAEGVAAVAQLGWVPEAVEQNNVTSTRAAQHLANLVREAKGALDNLDAAREAAAEGTGRFSVTGVKPQHYEIDEKTLFGAIEGILDKSIADINGNSVDVRYRDDEERAAMINAAKNFYNTYKSTELPVSTGAVMYFAPSHKTVERYGGDMTKAWAEYAIHAVTNDSTDKDGKHFRSYGKEKVEVVMPLIPQIVAADNVAIMHGSAVYYFKVDERHIARLVANPEYGNLRVDNFIEVTATYVRQKKFPDAKPLIRAVEAWSRGGDVTNSSTDVTTIAYPGENVNGENDRLSVTFSPEARAQAQREYDAVVKQYFNTDQWLKAPNGKPTNLTERQWVQVRTPSFKKWFGDWEAMAEIEVMKQTLADWTSTLADFEWAKEKTLAECESKFGNEKVAIAYIPTWAMNQFTGKAVDNRVYCSKGYFIDHAANHGHADITMEDYRNLQEMFDSPEEVIKDTRAKPNGVARDSLIFVKKFARNRLAIVELSEQDGHIVLHKSIYNTRGKVYPSLPRVDMSGGGRSPISHVDESTPGGSLSARDTNNVPNFINPVNQNSVSKVVDENGEPLVVYHGTDEWNPLSDETENGFDTIQRGRHRENTGAWFTASSDQAHMFGGNVVGCFLNIRNPYEIDADGASYEEIPSGYEARIFRNGVLVKDLKGEEWKHQFETKALAEDDAKKRLNDIEKVKELLFNPSDTIEVRVVPSLKHVDSAVRDGRYLNHDGAIINDIIDGDAGRGDYYVAFSPSQIKSATDNIGTFDAANNDIRFSISGIYTGSAADYAQRLEDGTIVNGPSLHYIGEGVGAQVYGYGLYGSSQREEGERFANEASGRKWKQEKGKPRYTYIVDGNPVDTIEAYGDGAGVVARQLQYGKTIDAIRADAEERLQTEQDESIKEKVQRVIQFLDEHSIEVVEYKPEAHRYLYEQTFFTNRADGDESHLLNWFAKVEDEQLNWLEELGVSHKTHTKGSFKGSTVYSIGDTVLAIMDARASLKQGDLYGIIAEALGSPKAATEWLVAKDIDGVKYPVNASNGSDGWNYVSFRDATIRVDHKWVDGEQRFSISARRPDLVGLHNMSAEGLKGADALGGFAMPSIAITKDAMGHNEFGEITLLMRPSSFDPQVNRQNKLYSRDAWTPTFPGIVNKANVKQIEKVSERLLATIPDNVRNALGHNEAYRLIYEDGIQETFQSRQTAGDAYGTNVALKAAYLISQGETIEPVMTKKSFIGGIYSDRLSSLGDSGLRKVNDLIGDKLMAWLALPGAEQYDNFEDYRGDFENTLREIFYEQRIAKNPKIKDYPKESITNLYFGKGHELRVNEARDLADSISRLRDAIAKGVDGEQVLDKNATKRAIDDRVKNHAPEFEAWLDEQYGDPILARGIRNNKEFYTPSGNRRSWDALHDPVSLANVVKIMLSKQREQGGGAFGLNPFGVGAAKFKTFKDVIKNEELLKNLPQEEMEELRMGFINAFGDISDRYLATWEYKDSNRFIAHDNSNESLLEAWVDSKGTFAGLKRELNAYGRTASDELIRDFMDLMNGIAKFPTAYFEAKPMRAVGFEEVAAAIIPNDASAETREILQRRGVATYEYTAGDSESRKAALNQAADEHDGTRFSLILGERGAANLHINLNAMNNLSVAKQMLGDDDWATISKEQKQKIKRATGWEKGVDGKWRYEWLDFKVRDIEDDRRTIVSKMTSAERRKFNDYMWNIDTLSDKRRANFKAMREKYGYKLNDELTLADILYGNGANGLFNAYPKLRDMRVRFVRLLGDTLGWYDDKLNEIVIKEDYLGAWNLEILRRVLTHEVQHVIQGIEGFALGGHPILNHANELADQYNNLVSRYNAGEPIPSAEIDASYKKYLDARSKAHDDYIRIAGEVESRNAESRRYLNFKDYPTSLLLEDTEDIGREGQIILGEVRDALSKVEDAMLRHDIFGMGAKRAAVKAAEAEARAAVERLSINALYHGRSPYADDIMTSDFIERVTADSARLTGKAPSARKLQQMYADLGVKAPEGKALADTMNRIQRIVDDKERNPLEDYISNLSAMTDDQLKAYSRGVQDASRQWTHGVFREVQQVARERKAEAEAVTGITPEVIAAENGFDPLATIVLSNDRKLTEEERAIRDQKRKEAREKREAEVRQELEGNAPEFDEDLVTPDYLAALEVRKAKLREATKQFEAERREALKRLEREHPQVDEEGNPIEGAVDEDEQNLDEIRAKVFEGIAYDLDDPMDINEFVAMLQYLAVEHTLGHAPTSAEMREAMKDPIAVRDFARTAAQMADSLADQLCYGYGRERAKQAAERMSAAETAYQARRLALSAFMTISNCRIRDTKKSYYKRMKKALKDGIQRGQFATNREDLDRKVTADLEVELREIRKVLDMGPMRLQKYRKEAMDKRMAFGSERVENETTWRDLMTADVQIAIADEFGGWRDKTLGEIEELTLKIEQMVETGKNDMDARREKYVRQVQSLVDPLVTACLENAQQFGAETLTGKEKVAQWLENKIVGMQKLLLEGLVFGKVSPQNRIAAERVVKTFARDFDHAAAVKNTKVTEYQKRLDEINKACYGSTQECVEAHSEEVPEWLNAILTNRTNTDIEAKKAEAKANGENVEDTITQSTRFTRGQAIQLYASITQADYAENARLWQRDGEALKALRNYLTEADVNWVAQMSAFFAETFPELQDCFKRITGRTIGTTKNYFPVKMKVPREGIAGKVRMYSNFYASMEPRRRNALDFDESVSALDMVIGRMDEFAHMLAYGELGIIVNDVFGNARLIKAIEKSKGKEYLHRLHANLLDSLMGAEATDSETALGLRRVAQWTSVIAMSGNVGSAIKQFGGIPSFANEIGFSGLANAYKEYFSKDGWEWDYIKTTPEYKARYQVGNNPDMMATITGQPMSRLAKAYRGGMKLQMWADEAVAKAVVVGLFRMKLRQYLAEGMEENKAREYANTDAWGVVERTQQSGYEHNRHHFIRNSAWFRLFTTFKTTPIQMVQVEAKAWVDYLRGEEGAGRKLISVIFTNHVLGPLALTMLDAAFNGLVLGGFTTDDDDKRERLLKRLAYQFLAESILGPTAAIPILGGIGECIIEFFTEGKESALSVHNLEDKALQVHVLNTTVNTISHASSLLNDLFTLDINELLQDAEDVLHKNVAPYRQFKTAMENWTDEDWDEFLEREFPKKD